MLSDARFAAPFRVYQPCEIALNREALPKGQEYCRSFRGCWPAILMQCHRASTSNAHSANDIKTDELIDRVLQQIQFLLRHFWAVSGIVSRRVCKNDEPVVISGEGRIDQGTAGSLTMGSSLKGAMVSKLI